MKTPSLAGPRPARRLGRMLVAVTTALSTAGITAGPASSTAGARPSGCRVERERVPAGEWTTINIPVETSDPQPVRASGAASSRRADRRERHENFASRIAPFDYAVEPALPARIYVSDERDVYVSSDGGCSWERSLRLLDFPPSDGQTGVAAIASVVAPQSVGGAVRAYALVDHGGRPLLAALERSSGRWLVEPVVTTSDGLPVLGHPVRLWVAPSDPSVLYLTIATDYAHGRWRLSTNELALYRSLDSGASWELRNVGGNWGGPLDRNLPGSECVAPDRCPGIQTDLMEVDPSNAAVLWTAGRVGIFRSADGGSTWEKVFPATEQVLGRLSGIDVVSGRGGLTRVAAFGWRKTAWSDDGGRTWDLRAPSSGFRFTGQQAIGGELTSIASSAAASIVVTAVTATSHGGANVRWLHDGRWSLITPRSSGCPDEGPCLSRMSYIPRLGVYFAAQARPKRDSGRYPGSTLMTFTPAR